jgi:hypothetical protein
VDCIISLGQGAIGTPFLTSRPSHDWNLGPQPMKGRMLRNSPTFSYCGISMKGLASIFNWHVICSMPVVCRFSWTRRKGETNGPIENKCPVCGLYVVFQTSSSRTGSRGRRVCQEELAQISLVSACRSGTVAGQNRSKNFKSERQSYICRVQDREAKDVGESAQQTNLGPIPLTILHSRQPFLHFFLDGIEILHADRQADQSIADSLALFLRGADVAMRGRARMA